MSDAPSVLLIDDGELDDVAALLEELRADVTRLRGGGVPDQVAPPRDLFVTTSRRARLVDSWTACDQPAKIAIVTEDSNTLRAMLRRQGFDLLVRRPVHPYALRLILLRGLFAGDEKRRSSRVAVGHPVSYRSGFRRNPATLTDLSRRVCGLLVEKPIALGARLTLQIPRELTGGSALSLRAKVARARPARDLGAAQSLGLVFERISDRGQKALDQLVRSLRFSPPKSAAGADHAPSPARQPRPAAAAAPAPIVPAVPTLPAAAAGAEDERRRDRRAIYTKEVIRLDNEAHNVLMGRDISLGGMRVEPHTDLAPGGSVQLAIYGDAREEPLIVADAERRAGLALQPFGYYHPVIHSEIQPTTGDNWKITLQIDKGPPVLIVNYQMVINGPGKSDTTLLDWQANWPLTSGHVLDQSVWEEQKLAALDLAEAHGYLGAAFIQQEIRLDLEKNKADLILVLETGEQAVMGSVVYNQDIVKNSVLENIPRFSKGQPYDAWLLEEFRLDLWRTGYFESIDVIEERRLEDSPPQVNLTVTMEARKRNTYQGSLGYGTDTGMRASATWSRHLLSSRGDSLEAGIGWQQQFNELSLPTPQGIRAAILDS